MDRRTFLARTSAAGLAILITPDGLVASREQAGAASDFAEAFLRPPPAAKPRVLWFWMNGNVTKEGITQDLEAMARIGVGGVLNFDAGTLIPKGPVVYLGPEWLELKAHAAREADRLGLDFTMHNCPGWSSSGGPWITPDFGMQQLVWSETIVTGGTRVRVRLPKPFARLDHYKAVAVVACPTLPGEAALDQVVVRATAGTSAVDVTQLASEAGLDLNASSGTSGTLVLELRESTDITSMSFVRTSLEKESPRGEGQPAQLQLSVSDDGITFKTATTIDPSGLGGAPGALVKASFAPVRARFLRLQVPGGAHVAQLRLSSFAEITDWAKKANVSFGVDGPATAEASVPASIVPHDRVLDLTSHMNADGDLDWDAPAGKWTILRFGHTALGTMNRSAPDTGIGLECDKYRKAAIEFHFDRMMGQLLPVLGPLAAKGRVGLEIDSYEVGMQNWTPDFPREFAARRGYDLVAFLPAMTGRIVGSTDESDRFLWDVRRAQGDLIAENYYGRFVELCHAHGIVAYIEPYDRGPMQELQIGSHADIPLCEFWFGLSSIFQNNWTMRRTPKLAASIAHASGKSIVAAESFTGEPESARWQEHPFAMKVLGDRMFTQGVNRIVFHRFAHQPHPTARPGMTMGPWGIHFDRTTTWWEQAGGWMTYLARCQSLLQSGQFAADLAYVADEDANRYTIVERDRLDPVPPDGYDYDVIDAETVIARLSRDRTSPSRVSLPDGTTYSVIVLQRRAAISLALLNKLRALVAEGAVLVGSRPERSLGLHGGTAEDAEVRLIADEMWGPIDGTTVTEHQVERGRVIWGRPLADVLTLLSLPPDFESSSRSGDAPLLAIHRRIASAGRSAPADVYFVSNQRRTREDVVCTFRVAGRQPELWDPVTGAQAPCAMFSVEGNRTHVPLQLGPSGCVFVVFRQSSSGSSVAAIAKDGTPAISATPLPAKERVLHSGLAGTFTMALWAKPENHVMLATNGFMEHVKDPWTDGYAVYPAPGESLYGDGHATAGLTVGRNGVVIWEHASRVPVLRFAATATLSGWTHIAAVYRDGEPTIYVNGRFAGRGTRGPWTVHPGAGEAFLREGASYYQGDMTAPTVVAAALDETQLQSLIKSGPQRPTTTPLVEIVTSPAGAFRFWADGNYQVQAVPGRTRTVRVAGAGRVTRVTGPWDIRFPRGFGAPDIVRLDTLKSLHLLDNPKLRYFSGTATWSATFEPPEIASSRIRVILDLGEVEVLASVRVNGHDLGSVWTRPFQVDVTEALTKGTNTLDVAVTNLWPNRLIGDEQLPDPDQFVTGVPAGAFSPLVNGSIQQLPEWYQRGLPKPDDGRVTFTTWKHYTKQSPLLASGLVGPVAFWTAEVRRL